MKRVDWFNIALLLALFAWSVHVWPELPERIPRHFNAYGEVDAWGSKSAGTWFLLPVIAMITLGVMQFANWLMMRRPAALNIPAKKQFMQLPREEQAPILGEVANFIRVLTTLLLALFGAIQYATYRAALGESTRTLLIATLVLSLGLTPLLTIGLIVRTTSQVNAAVRRATLRGTLTR